MLRPALPRLPIAVAGRLGVVGSAGDWGALSTVPSQAAAVAPTRIALAVLFLAAGGRAVAGRGRAMQSIAAVLFAVASLLGWTEWRYAGIQAAQHGGAGASWGLALVMLGAAAGLLLCGRELPAGAHPGNVARPSAPASKREACRHGRRAG
ncbi:MAG TPA: hypothetical protein VHI93_03835 [Candidatus Thermoplasmatota archaeon]|nr:hypothetical protein [Candidatus Thermoplasmatota archaeon]